MSHPFRSGGRHLGRWNAGSVFAGADAAAERIGLLLAHESLGRPTWPTGQVSLAIHVRANGGEMRGYKLYLLDENDRIRSAMDLECADDADAIQLAQSLLDGPMELWQGARIVRRFYPEDDRPAARQDPLHR
jgi:hypothetical protein